MIYDLPHRRFNPLTGEWLLVSPHRARRPWLGQVENPPAELLPSYDPQCYLCPGNARAGGLRNPEYSATYVFDNDFPALLSPGQAASLEGESPASPAPGAAPAGLDAGAGAGASLFAAQPEYGLCRVVCFSPRHDLNIPELSQAAVEAVVRTWIDQTRELGSLEFTAYVQIFENKGAMMGASNPHPHSQMWASSSIPNEPAKELRSQSAYLERHGRCLLCDYLAAEREAGERLVAANEHFTAVVPFWAVWPFELLVLANRHVSSLTDLDGGEVSSLANLMRRVTARYETLFRISFPYSMGFHQAPTDGGAYPQHHLHAHYYPPLLRSATVRKFMVGYEMLATPQRDLTPESAAERLRSLSERPFRASPARRRLCRT